MSRCYLDTNFLYGHFRTPVVGTGDGQFDRWRSLVLAEVADDSAVMSALVVDELAYRLVLAWLRDDGDRDPLSTYRSDAGKVMTAMADRLGVTWAALAELALDLEPTDALVVEDAQRLMADPGVAPRDAFHAAHARRAGCRFVVSSDTGFDRVPGILRLGPPT